MSMASLTSQAPLLAEILDAMPERVARYRLADRVVVYCNAAWAAGHHGTPTAFVGRPLDELLTPPEIEGMWAQLGRLSRDEPLLTDPEPRQAPEDPSCWIEWVDLLIPSPDGDEVLSIGRDVTARHEAQVRLGESERRFRLAMTNAPVGMAIVGADNRLLETNEALQDFLGRSRDELGQLTWQQITHPADVAEEQRLVTELLTGTRTSFTYESRYFHADGSIVWALTTSTLIRDAEGRPLYALAHLVDVTARKAAEQQAVQGARLQHLAGLIARIGGWEWDVTTRRLAWSREAVARLGYPEGEEPDLEEFLDLHPPEARAELQDAMDRCLEDGTPWDLELPMRSRHGEPLWVRSVGEPFRDEQDTVTRLWGALQDITERKRAELETNWLAEQLTATLDRVDDGFLTVDHDWCVNHVSPRGADIFDREVEDLVGHRLWDVLPEFEHTEIHRSLKRAMDEQVVVEVDRYPDLRLHSWFELAAHPSSRGLVVFFRDVTDQVAREATLQRAIETEQQAADRLRELDRAKNAFLSAVSHELRTPLTIVHGMAVSLQRMRADISGDIRAKVENALVNHAEHLRELLDELLDVDRLARGTLEATRVRIDLADLVRKLLLEREADDRVTLQAPASLVRAVDPVQFERIVTNLLGNALKYAPAGPIEIDLAPLGDGLRLTVRDHGPGVPEDERERIFEPFHRVDEAHPQPGTGVGLALVVDFVRLHDGRVWVEAVPDEDGARFVVEIPGPSGPPQS